MRGQGTSDGRKRGHVRKVSEWIGTLSRRSKRSKKKLEKKPWHCNQFVRGKGRKPRAEPFRRQTVARVRLKGPGEFSIKE